MVSNGKTSKLVASLNGRAVSVLHTVLAASAFLSALIIGCALHYTRIVKNQYYGYPEEWFPSVSATIGDWFPERNIFQICIALTSGPRLLLVLFSYLLARSPHSSLPGFVGIVGFLRTLSAGGWMFVTSSDKADVHDAAMISYIVLNIPWMWGTVHLSARDTKRKRRIVASAFFATLVPLVYLYIQHKVHQVPGAYTRYAFFEWSLIGLDVLFDSFTFTEFAGLEVRIVDARAEANLSENLFHLAPPMLSADKSAHPSVLERAVTKLFARTAEWRSFLALTYLYYLFWTLLTALPTMIFYYAVWSMGLSGDEVLLLSVLSPFLLGIGPVRRFVARNEWLGHLGLVLGASVYLIDDQGEYRLRLVALSLAVSLLGAAERWSRSSEGLELGSGLLLSVLLKHANFSINPAWPFMADWDVAYGPTGGYNTILLIIGILAFVQVAFGAKIPTTNVTNAQMGVLRGSIAFGSLFFALHLLGTDAGTAIAWAHEGWPTGPTAMPHGSVYILAFSIAIGSASNRQCRSPFVFAFAVLSATVLYLSKRWTAFVAGLFVSAYGYAALPSLMDDLRTDRPGLLFGLAMLVYVVLELVSVWTVAYAFVPAGWLLRERTDIMLTLMMAGLSLAVDWSPVALPTTAWPHTTRTRHLGALIALSAVAVVYHRRRRALPEPHHAEGRVVTAGIWTMHFALDGRMWESQRRIADLIRDAELDVIGLLESDVQRIVMGNRDMTQYIAHELNMYADIGPAPSGHTWGCALLSKFPILNSTHHLLPSPHGELAPAIHATLDMYGVHVDVVVSHNGQEEDPLDRELQSRELARIMREAWPRPVIFLGYVVTTPLAERPAPYRFLVEDGLVVDVDETDDDRWCEYILFRGLHRVAYARLTRGSQPAITDTELQVAKFTVPFDDQLPKGPPPSIDDVRVDPSAPSENGDEVKRTPRIVSLAPSPVHSVRVPAQHVPESRRFPTMFHHQGVRGHAFHVLTGDDGSYGAWYYNSEEYEKIRKEREQKEINECKVQ